MCDRHGLALAYEVTVAGPGVALTEAGRAITFSGSVPM
ncbi:hypothetical protein MPL3356_120024 [Mesorhizobium plurifarium]|uniref:Uncharacterized protein n=1 Tax=Mesorhizobium plurifarium TaxID=69974 RepID=A0A090DB31_MESPL|nr:hypothetical protein MPL3356_120024 [Mesorhizobium plurifarium]